ncbi:O-antigen translocase [Aliihoeflea sp. 40Bstr573]|uniref:O-antigen translocase n=1 Tax=Aliihoeflea sp. 40Bstr573 TaxID=2696467 RepID=UPI00209433B9|nr:O-antigen translocase [Aliihoeflea sp. 40Bstr573]MCO6388799.1 oligosaccharide flippase family protein [Aliihoeflea sp. 40Bstr573]
MTDAVARSANLHGAPTKTQSGSCEQIVKSTALIGASSLISIVFSIIRYKAFAILLGPAGVGLFGLYNSMLDLGQTLSGLGVQTSGVRQIANAEGGGDSRQIALTTIVVRRISLVLALLGGAGFALIAPLISGMTVGEGLQGATVLLGLAIAFRLIAGGQLAVVQGHRRIADLAWMNTIGAAASTLIGVPLIYWWGSDGIAPALVLMAVVQVAASWWYSRKIVVASLAIGWPEMRKETLALLRLGFVFMVSGVLTLGSAYVIRLIVLHHDGLLAAGLYQAAWTVGGLYASFILQAMAADFYPRLTAVCDDDEACNRLVNEQVQVSILLAGPGVLATLTLAPVILSLLYSGEFLSAVDLLRWICLGMMLRILAWPLGFIIVARAANRTFFWTEVAATVVHVGLAWFLVMQIGIMGAGIAFFGLYVWHCGLVYVIVRIMCGFRWSPDNLRLIGLFTGASTLLLLAFALLPVMVASLLGLACTCACGLYSLKLLAGLLSVQSLPARLRPIASRYFSH